MSEPNPSQILIVDDNVVNRKLIRRYVLALGHQTHEVEDGAAALAFLEYGQVDLMLLDLYMPVLNGLGVLEKLREANILHRLPVIMISSYDETDAVAKCIEKGAADYLVKPFKPALFKARVSACLERKHFHDIERIYQERIEETNNMLRQREAALHASLAKEKELNRLKTRFVAMASHEFRTPLTSILTAADMLSRYGDRMDDANKHTRLQRIKDEVHHMVYLLEEILLIGKVEANKLDFKPTCLDLRTLSLDKAEEMMAHSGGHRELIVEELGTQFWVTADQRHLLRIVDNLISNAIKYSPDNSHIFLSLEEKENTTTLTVRDEGIGIPEEDLAHMFEPFHRAENVGTIPGTGLGLAIIKRIVDLHGGAMHLTSEINRGTEVKVTLPTAQDPAATPYEVTS